MFEILMDVLHHATRLASATRAKTSWLMACVNRSRGKRSRGDLLRVARSPGWRCPLGRRSAGAAVGVPSPGPESAPRTSGDFKVCAMGPSFSALPGPLPQRPRCPRT